MRIFDENFKMSQIGATGDRTPLRRLPKSTIGGTTFLVQGWLLFISWAENISHPGSLFVPSSINLKNSGLVVSHHLLIVLNDNPNYKISFDVNKK